MVKDVDLIFHLIDDVVEEVGEDIVVQATTDNASAYKAVGGDVTTLTNNDVNFGTSSKKVKDPPTKYKGKGLASIDDEDDELIDHIMDEEADISVGHHSDSSLNLSSDEK
ncbi:hypothetical protein Q3G72_025474 [Acer saccharum]|nr:hypothetical protein Q3G72_025474 [Acer saccharum]